MTDLSTSASASSAHPEEQSPPDDNGDPSGDDPSSDAVPIAENEPVRWRRQAGARWHLGAVIGREADGSIAVRDTNGAWRSIPVDRLEAQTVTKRGAKKWVPLADRDAVPVELMAPDDPEDPDVRPGTDTDTRAEEETAGTTDGHTGGGADPQ